MGNIGSSEILLILVLALLLLGPRRLPEVGASVGRMLRKFRQASRDLRDEMDVSSALRLDDYDDPPARKPPASTQARTQAEPDGATESGAAPATTGTGSGDAGDGGGGEASAPPAPESR